MTCHDLFLTAFWFSCDVIVNNCATVKTWLVLAHRKTSKKEKRKQEKKIHESKKKTLTYQGHSQKTKLIQQGRRACVRTCACVKGGRGGWRGLHVTGKVYPYVRGSSICRIIEPVAKYLFPSSL